VASLTTPWTYLSSLNQPRLHCHRSSYRSNHHFCLNPSLVGGQNWSHHFGEHSNAWLDLIKNFFDCRFPSQQIVWSFLFSLFLELKLRHPDKPTCWLSIYSQAHSLDWLSPKTSSSPLFQSTLTSQPMSSLAQITFWGTRSPHRKHRWSNLHSSWVVGVSPSHPSLSAWVSAARADQLYARSTQGKLERVWPCWIEIQTLSKVGLVWFLNGLCLEVASNFLMRMGPLELQTYASKSLQFLLTHPQGISYPITHNPTLCKCRSHL